MIEWFAWAQVALALIVAVLSLINFARKLGPNDVTLGGTLLVALLLVVQIVVSIVAPFVGNEPTGDLLEFWLYLITALILPIGAAFWALTDRTRWSNLILAIAAFSVAVMVYRMLFIWTVQIA
jgi:hypothetical protein